MHIITKKGQAMKDYKYLVDKYRFKDFIYDTLTALIVVSTIYLMLFFAGG